MVAEATQGLTEVGNQCMPDPCAVQIGHSGGSRTRAHHRICKHLLTTNNKTVSPNYL